MPKPIFAKCLNMCRVYFGGGGAYFLDVAVCLLATKLAVTQFILKYKYDFDSQILQIKWYILPS